MNSMFEGVIVFDQPLEAGHFENYNYGVYVPICHNLRPTLWGYIESKNYWVVCLIELKPLITLDLLIGVNWVVN